jgi:hypothetical protein
MRVVAVCGTIIAEPGLPVLGRHSRCKAEGEAQAALRPGRGRS